jgi:exopolysaccharide biosynthesis polyprenyl glycosylphosphotransferase
MATSEFWQRITATLAASHEAEGLQTGSSVPASRGTTKLWILLDVLTVLVSSIIATLFDFHLEPYQGAHTFWRGTLIQGRSTGLLLALLCWFTFILIFTSRRFNIYNPKRLSSFLHEQRLSLQASMISALVLTGTLYLVHADDIPRALVLITISMVAVLLGLRRFVYRILLYRRYEQGLGTRNVLIVGSGPEALALRHHLKSMRNLGYNFKGFVEVPGAHEGFPAATASEVIGSIDALFQNARKQFVDEIFLTSPCDRDVVQSVYEQARVLGVDLRVVPDMYDGLAWNSPIEYIGQFPTIPLYYNRSHDVGLALKRLFDIAFSATVLVLTLPLLLLLALAVKLDSPGPVFYHSERIGKKGRVFRCAKFRTMVQDAEQRKAEISHLNERDDVLFKISNDPRLTRLGRFLRKYSFDELPQFFNVLRGDMSVVGPRPPIASEVKKYNLSHLRRLQVTPGITGLWQVQGRRDPSFASYVSLDVAYIENWSIWLDFKIVVRTVFVVFAGTGS